MSKLLDAISKQTYYNFEVIVVNGPSNDETNDILEKYNGSIHQYRCPTANLSMSRNIGVKNAAGDIVAFIDDDAIPMDPNWIKNAIRYFENEKVGIVGGTVYGSSGELLFHCGWFDIWGQNKAIQDECIIYDDPNGERFSCGQGCNVFFRTKAIIEAGGFDEYFTFYLEESDMGMRIIQRGYMCRFGEDIGVVHEAAKGPNRRSEIDINWYVICRSQGYFILKATEKTGKSREERADAARRSVEHWKEAIRKLLETNSIDEDEYCQFTENIKKGIEQGIKDANEHKRQLFFQYKQDDSLFFI